MLLDEHVAARREPLDERRPERRVHVSDPDDEVVRPAPQRLRVFLEVRAVPVNFQTEPIGRSTAAFEAGF